MLTRPAELTALLAGLTAHGRRDALRALRGQLLRSELYALDGADRRRPPVHGHRDGRPAFAGGVAGLPPRRLAADREPIFFPFPAGSRTTQWERGDRADDPVHLPRRPDAYGLPPARWTSPSPAAATRGRRRTRRRRGAVPGDVHDHRVRPAGRADALPGRPGRPDDHATRWSTTAGLPRPGSRRRPRRTAACREPSLRVIGQAHTFYDGDAFTGLPLGQLGDHGLATRTETLAFTDAFLDDLLRCRRSARGRPAAAVPGARRGRPGPGSTRPSSATVLPALAGYVHHTDADVPGSAAGYWIQTARHRYDVHPDPDHPAGCRAGCRSSPSTRSARRPGSTTTSTTCCRSTVTDPAGLTTTAAHDLRVLQPRQVTDVNGNTACGHLHPARAGRRALRAGQGRRRRGRPDAARHRADLRPARLRRGPRPGVGDHRAAGAPRHRHRRARRAAGRGDPVGAVLRRVRPHPADPRPGRGRPVRRPDLRRRRDPGRPDPPRSARPSVAPGTRPTRTTSSVSGWQVYDNKGRGRAEVRALLRTGLRLRAAAGRPARAEGGDVLRPARPAGPHASTPTAARAVVVLGVPADLDRARRVPRPPRGRPTPTTPTTTPAAPTRTSAAGYADHWNTPASIEVDALGRTVTAVARNGHRRRRPDHHPHRATTSRATSSRSPTRSGRRGVRLPVRPAQAALADGQHRRRSPRQRPRRRRRSRSRRATARARSPCRLRPAAPAVPGLGPRRRAPAR